MLGELGNPSALLGAVWPMVMGSVIFGLSLVVYWFALRDASQEGSAAAEDTQIGIKVALHMFAALAILIAAGGAQSFFHFILAKMKGGAPSSLIKGGIGHIVAGGGLFFVVWQFLLPRTNWQEHDKVTRLTVGAVAILAGLSTVGSFSNFFAGVISGSSWAPVNAPALATVLVMGGLAFVALNKLGSMSGWVAPPPKAAGFPPMGGGGGYQQQMPQQPPQQGYPPQGGYPPAGGAPPAGGGYPPAGGGAPPGGGGYPPQGGGGLPPPSGGYPPQGGGGQGY